MSGSGKVKCPCCDGKGSIETYSEVYDIYYPVKCSMCDGSGEIYKEYLDWLKRNRRPK